MSTLGIAKHHHTTRPSILGVFGIPSNPRCRCRSTKAFLPNIFFLHGYNPLSTAFYGNLGFPTLLWYKRTILIWMKGTGWRCNVGIYEHAQYYLPVIKGPGDDGEVKIDPSRPSAPHPMSHPGRRSFQRRNDNLFRDCIVPARADTWNLDSVSRTPQNKICRYLIRTKLQPVCYKQNFGNIYRYLSKVTLLLLTTYIRNSGRGKRLFWAAS